MKHLKAFKVFESLSNNISIEDFVKKIGIDSTKQPVVVEWWNENRSNFKIHYFPFSCFEPIAGCFLGTDTICINERLYFPAFMKLFIALHESKHADQHSEGRLMPGYYDTVVENNKDEFLKSYKQLEEEANDFAIQSMIECGFADEMRRESIRLKSNEGAGDVVWSLMRRDIQRLQPKDFIDLMKKQIL